MSRFRLWLQARGWSAHVTVQFQSGFISTPWGIISLVGPANRALWSERHRRGMHVLPLGGGWRIRWRTRP
jgi:hypothetical protein